MWGDNEYKSVRINDVILSFTTTDHRSPYYSRGFKHRVWVAPNRFAEVMLWAQQFLGPCLTTRQYKHAKNFMPKLEVTWLIDDEHVYLTDDAVAAMKLAWFG